MSEDLKQHVNTHSAEFKQGLEAGLDSAEDTKNWQAGNELGQELKRESETIEPVDEPLSQEPSTPIFMEDSPEGNKGNAQDEKDGAAE